MAPGQYLQPLQHPFRRIILARRPAADLTGVEAQDGGKMPLRPVDGLQGVAEARGGAAQLSVART